MFRTYKKPATTVLASIENTASAAATAAVNKTKTKKPKISKKDIENVSGKFITMCVRLLECYRYAVHFSERELRKNGSRNE